MADGFRTRRATDSASRFLIVVSVVGFKRVADVKRRCARNGEFQRKNCVDGIRRDHTRRSNWRIGFWINKRIAESFAPSSTQAAFQCGQHNRLPAPQIRQDCRLRWEGFARGSNSAQQPYLVGKRRSQVKRVTRLFQPLQRSFPEISQRYIKT